MNDQIRIPLPVTTRTTPERRSAGSGTSVIVPVRIKPDAIKSIDVRCGELGLNRSEYFRTRITEDIGVVT